MKTPPAPRPSGAAFRRASARPGFTLVEILIAIALIVAVVSIAVGNLGKIFDDGRRQIAETFVKDSLDTPMMAYRLQTGNYPTTEQGLKALISAPEGATNWHGPYFNKTEIPKDPWQADYRYANPGPHNAVLGKYDAWSTGPDRADATTDDVGNW